MFDPRRTLIDRQDEWNDMPFILVVEAIPMVEVHLYIQAFEYNYLKTEAFTPFHPEEGYVVTEEGGKFVLQQ